jgi:hypothetical protein
MYTPTRRAPRADRRPLVPRVTSHIVVATEGSSTVGTEICGSRRHHHDFRVGR